MTLTSFPALIASRDDVLRLIEAMLDRVGGGFHPDTPAAEYTDDAGSSVFGDEAVEVDRLMAAAFALLGDDVYEIALPMLHDRLEPNADSPPVSVELTGEEAGIIRDALDVYSYTLDDRPDLAAKVSALVAKLGG